MTISTLQGTVIPLAWVISGNIRGPQGAAGAAGSPGAAGADGSDGADGTSVLPKGDVATYGNLPGGRCRRYGPCVGEPRRRMPLHLGRCRFFPTEGAGPTWRGPKAAKAPKATPVTLALTVRVSRSPDRS